MRLAYRVSPTLYEAEVNVLVTGAGGFLGRATVSALLEAGHNVRAMLRPAAAVPPWRNQERCQIVRIDLRAPCNLDLAMQDVDMVVHLAAAVIAPDASHYAVTVGGTERLIEAMSHASVRRVILASSFSVYDWTRARRIVDESSPIETRPYARGAYAAAKLWQERLLERASKSYGWELTILRPGVIWGPGNEGLFMAGWPGRKLHFVLGPRRSLPITYIDNCAAAFVKAVECAAPPRIVNVIDDNVPTAWQFMGEYLNRTKTRGMRVPIPFFWAQTTAWSASLCSRIFFGKRGKLPSMLMPVRLAVFRSLRFPNHVLKRDLEWRPVVSFDQALNRVFAPGAMYSEDQ